MAIHMGQKESWAMVERRKKDQNYLVYEKNIRGAYFYRAEAKKDGLGGVFIRCSSRGEKHPSAYSYAPFERRLDLFSGDVEGRWEEACQWVDEACLAYQEILAAEEEKIARLDLIKSSEG